MSDLSDFIENHIGNHIFRNQAYTPATTIYLALFTSATADAGTGTEASGSAYARKSFTFDAWTGTSGLQDNGSAITFVAASGGNWGTITHVAIMDALTTGNMMAHGALTSSVIINDGDTFEVAAGDLDLTIA